MQKNSANRNRIVSIDILRIFSMIMIFLFHSNIHLQCKYGIVTVFISQSAIFMDMFFILSGFALYYTNYKKDMHSLTQIKKFYVKRILGIYPVYLVICLIYLIFKIDADFSILKKLIVFPMDIMMLQSTINGTFSNLHHGGTWFVSCLFFCYILSPFFIEITKQIKNRIYVLLVGIYLICSYIPIVTHIEEYSTTYSNIIYRCMHFFIGMLIAAIFLQRKKKYNERTYILISLFALMVLILCVSLLKHFIGGSYSDYDFIVILCCAVMVYFSAFITFKGKYINKFVNSKAIKYLNSIAYEFFIGQFFCFKITQKIVSEINLFDNNISKIIISAVLCFGISVLLHELISKPFKKILLNKLIKEK